MSTAAIEAGPAPRYLTLDELVGLMHEPARGGVLRLLEQHRERFESTPGSSHNHQAWPGGYLDHVREVMNVCVVLYASLGALRPLPFTLSDALLVAFVHDIEKPWKYERGEHGALRHASNMQGKDAHHTFRRELLANAGVELTAEQENGVRFAEGEMGAYSNRKRAMGPLAAFCHLADVTSARLWFEHPLADGDPWSGAKRSEG